jgi:E3 ubiquitin-protein ligase synoviolin
MVHLSSSKLSAAALGNLGLAGLAAGYRAATWAFLGRLRDAEVERVNDRFLQALVETLLAMTIFRQDITPAFAAAFALLSTLKVLHWLAQGRVDFAEAAPAGGGRAAAARVVALLLLLLATDLALLQRALAATLARGVSAHLLFAFEYAVQASAAAAALAKLALNAADASVEGGWGGKAVAVFYLDLALDLLHLVTYTAFFAAVFSTYGIPIHLVRDLFWTFRNFQRRVRDFLRYRRVAAGLERRFPDASAEDAERAGGVCIVCREPMAAGHGAKRLDCGHALHTGCLRSWLERQQNCPTCRAPVTAGADEGARREGEAQRRRAAGAAGGAGGAAGERPGAPGGEAGGAGARPRPRPEGGEAGGGAAPPPPGPWVFTPGPQALPPAGQQQPQQQGAHAAFAFPPPPAYGYAAPYGYAVAGQQPMWVPAPPLALFIPGGAPPPAVPAGVPLVPVLVMPGGGGGGWPPGAAAAGAPSPGGGAPSPAQHAAAAAIAAAAVAAAAGGAPPPAAASPAAAEAAAAADAALEAALQTQANTVHRQLETLRRRRRESQGGASPSPSPEGGGGSSVPAPAPAAATPEPPPPAGGGEAEEMRRRRLERFRGAAM